MQRGTTGTYEISTTGDEQVRAFVPYPLPPDPPLQLSNARQRLLEQATLALGRLDSVALLLTDPDLFLYAYVRREAVLSSQIEGTQSSLSDLLLFESGVTFPTATKGINALLELGIVGEVTSQRRNRVYMYDQYVAILNEGTELLRT
jgi:Fic family protein